MMTKIENEFKDNPEKVFRFLLFLIKWSNGKVALTPFVKAYNSFQVPDKQKHFSELLDSPYQGISELVSRTNVLSTIIRSFIYESSFKIDFATPQTLKEINLKLFTKYLNESTEFTNETFAILYHQVDQIDSSTKRVSVTAEALRLFKEFINKYPQPYLDLVIRSAMMPNFELAFVLEPYTFQMFSSKDEFMKFVESVANYPEWKKEKLKEYTEKSSVDDRSGVHKFHLTEEELSTGPIDFKNAWANLVPETLEKTYFLKFKSNFTFQQQLTVANDPNSNDHILDTPFEFSNVVLDVSIIPINTPFWRFGFKFSKDGQFPSKESGRHNSSNPDIHLSIGNPENLPDGKLKWKHDNSLVITEYNVKPLENKFEGSNTYKGEPVRGRFSLKDKDVPNIWKFEVFVNGQSVGYRLYDLAGYSHTRLSAWSDQNNFELATTIKLLSQFPFREPLI